MVCPACGRSCSADFLVFLTRVNGGQEFAVEEMLEKGLRKFNIRSLCQVANHTSVTLEVGLSRTRP